MEKVILIHLMVFFLCSCTNPAPKEDILQKYPHLKIFVIKKLSFKGEKCDLDIGELSFYYKTKYTSSKIFFDDLDKLAKINKWTVKYIHKNKRIYLKNLHRYPAQSQSDIVKIHFYPKTSIVYVIWKSG